MIKNSRKKGLSKNIVHISFNRKFQQLLNIFWLKFVVAKGVFLNFCIHKKNEDQMPWCKRRDICNFSSSWYHHTWSSPPRTPSPRWPSSSIGSPSVHYVTITWLTRTERKRGSVKMQVYGLLTVGLTLANRAAIHRGLEQPSTYTEEIVIQTAKILFVHPNTK